MTEPKKKDTEETEDGWADYAHGVVSLWGKNVGDKITDAMKNAPRPRPPSPPKGKGPPGLPGNRHVGGFNPNDAVADRIYQDNQRAGGGGGGPKSPLDRLEEPELLY